MQKHIVFTEAEWNKFRRQLGVELGKEMSRYTVTSKLDGVTVESDGRSGMFWIGTGILVIDEALKE